MTFDSDFEINKSFTTVKQQISPINISDQFYNKELGKSI